MKNNEYLVVTIKEDDIDYIENTDEFHNEETEIKTSLQSKMQFPTIYFQTME